MSSGKPSYTPKSNNQTGPETRLASGTPSPLADELFILTLGSTVPPLINQGFARTVLGHNLAQISSGILTLSTIFLIIVFVIDWRIKPPPPKHIRNGNCRFCICSGSPCRLFPFLSALPGSTPIPGSSLANDWNIASPKRYNRNTVC